MAFEYIKHKQKQLEKKRQREAKLKAEEEERLLAEAEAKAREQEEIAERKRLLAERQESERLHRQRVQAEQEMLSHKWGKQIDTLLADVDRLEREDDRLEEIRVIIGKREPSLQQLDWNAWLLSDPLNQRLADLDLEQAMELFKRDNLLAYRRKPTRGKKKVRNYVLTFGGAEGTRSYLTTGFNPDDFDLRLGFTVSYWVRPDEVGNTMFAFGRKHNANQRFTYGINTAKAIYVGVGGQRIRTTWVNMGATTNPQLADLFNASNELKTGNFIHFAATYADRTEVGDEVAHKIYINGELVRTTNLNWSQQGGGTGGMFIGARNLVGDYNNGWKCALSHLAIFDKEQSSAYIQDIYNAGRTGTDFTGQSGLVGYWKFNKGNGTTVTDHSGNGNNGTFATDGTGLPTWENT